MTNTYSLLNNETGEKVELPLVQGTLGPAGADVGKVYDKMDLFTYDPGFTSTCSCKSAITYIDGDKGILLYRGYPVDQLAGKSSFIEVAYLILNGELPNKAQLEAFEASIRRHTMINESLRGFFDGFNYDAHPMAMLTGIVGSLSAFYHDT
ncbi:MAG: citrate (Si)-synthase, partial [Nevskia sp.]|nr:citrate (Si)-synthase [Nevskia sp.]